MAGRYNPGMKPAAPLLALLLLAVPARAGFPIPEPTSFALPVPGGKFVFVQLGDPATEAKAPKPERQAFLDLRAKYPANGLYTAGDDAKLVWGLPDATYCAYDHCFAAPDGVHLVRIDGDFWKTESYTGGRLRPSAADEAAQLDGPGVSFFANGKLLKSHRVRDLIRDPDALPATPAHLLWYASGRLQVDTMRFNLFTQESIRHTFDATTGELVATQAVGLDNPLLPKILLVIGAMTAVIFAGWLAFLWTRQARAVAADGA